MSLRSIHAVAEELGLAPEHVLPWGRHRAKIELSALHAVPARKSRLVLVSAITPTPAGEGKTTTSLALAMGLRKRGRRAVAALREPSLGPVFGVKGGGTGGGQATMEPAQDINLHFTGDLHAITAAHNLLAALADNAVYFKAPIELDGRLLTWRRALDMNDRFLRNVLVGLGGKAHGVPREAGFDITAASEVMAILCLASSLKDLEARLGRIIIGQRADGTPVRASDLEAAPAMTALLTDAMLPNLVQTREGGPVIVHGGPFANIAHGCNSVLATRMALSYGDEVITEAGFGFDLGAEKFLDIKCRQSGLWPRGLVLVATLRALKFHGGVPVKSVADPNKDALAKGCENLEKHLETAKHFGLPVVVSVNRFPTDSEEELSWLRQWCRDRGVDMALCEGFAKGGDGSLELADRVLAMLDANENNVPTPQFTYAEEQSAEDKLRAIARKVYGAEEVNFSQQAKNQLENFRKMGAGNLPICVAKTHLSLSDDPTKQGRPRNFNITVREVRLSAGAGFLVALTGELVTMPGLPKEPASRRVVVHDDGRITGLMQNE